MTRQKRLSLALMAFVFSGAAVAQPDDSESISSSSSLGGVIGLPSISLKNKFQTSDWYMGTYGAELYLSDLRLRGGKAPWLVSKYLFATEGVDYLSYFDSAGTTWNTVPGQFTAWKTGLDFIYNGTDSLYYSTRGIKAAAGLRYGSDSANSFLSSNASLYACLPIGKILGSVALSGVYPLMTSCSGMGGVTISPYPSLEYWDPSFASSGDARIFDRALRASITAKLPLGTLGHIPLDITDKDGAVIYPIDYRMDLSLGVTAFYSAYNVGDDPTNAGSMAGGGLTLYVDCAQRASMLFKSSTSAFVAYDFQARQIEYGIYFSRSLPDAALPPY